MEIISLILALGLVISLYVNFNLNRKLKRTETYLEVADKNIIVQNELIDRLNDFITEADKTLRDSKLYGAFFSDDEIGGYFRLMNSIQDELNKFKNIVINWKIK